MAKLATRAALAAARKPAAKANWLTPQPTDVETAAPTWPTMTLDQLCISPHNVRTDSRDTDATSALEASIAKRGILLPLIAHPMVDQPGMFGVFAGGRRLRAVGRLHDRGEWDQTRGLPVIIRDLPEGELLELSTAENLLRRDLRDYEVFTAVRRAHEAGEDVAAIAEALGQETAWVKRCLRLAYLAPEIFAAYAAEKLTADQAKAYAATEDHDLQLQVFAQMQARPAYEHTAAKIHAALGVSDAQAARLLRFIGEGAYRVAGGRFELDLFADAAEVRGRIVDGDLLRQLAEEKLAGLKLDERAKAGRDLRFVVQPPRNDFGTDYALEIVRESDEPLPDGDVVVTIDVVESGEAQVRYWWASKKAKGGKPEKLFERLSRAAKRAEGSALRTGSGFDATAAQSANAAIREAEGLSSTGIEVMRSLRRTALRAMLIDEARRALQADIATDYLVWAQLRMMLMQRETSDVTGLASIARAWGDGPMATAGVVKAHVEATPGHAHWEAARAELSLEPFMTAKDPVASFKAFRAASRAVKDLASAFVVGLALERSLDADGYRVPVHDALVLDLMHGHAANADRAVRHWLPPTDAMLGLLPSKDLLTLADPWIERQTVGKWQRLKRPDLVQAVFDLVRGASSFARTARAQIAAMQWFHPLLAFGREGRTLAQVLEAEETPAEAVEAEAVA